MSLDGSGRNFLAQKPLRTKKMHSSFFPQKVLRTEVLRTEGFTHNIFYIQTLLRTDVFTRTQIADRNLCTQCAFTQPTFTQRGCASPSWSPTFRVPPLKYFLDTECFSFWKPWFWTCPAWLITNTLKLRRHWDDGNGWPIMEHILKICFTVHTSYTSITCVHVQYKDAYLCVWYVIRHINAEQDVTIMCVCVCRVPASYIYIHCVYTCAPNSCAHISKAACWFDPRDAAWSQDNDAFDQMIYVDSSLHETFNKLLEVTYREKATQDTIGHRQKKPQVW